MDVQGVCKPAYNWGTKSCSGLDFFLGRLEKNTWKILEKLRGFLLLKIPDVDLGLGLFHVFQLEMKGISRGFHFVGIYIYRG